MGSSRQLPKWSSSGVKPKRTRLPWLKIIKISKIAKGPPESKRRVHLTKTEQSDKRQHREQLYRVPGGSNAISRCSLGEMIATAWQRHAKAN